MLFDFIKILPNNLRGESIIFGGKINSVQKHHSTSKNGTYLSHYKKKNYFRISSNSDGNKQQSGKRDTIVKRRNFKTRTHNNNSVISMKKKE